MSLEGSEFKAGYSFFVVGPLLRVKSLLSLAGPLTGHSWVVDDVTCFYKHIVFTVV